MNDIIWKDMQEIDQRGQNWHWLQNKTVVVTGAYGMLASYIVYFLIYLNEVYPQMQIRIVAHGRNEEKMSARFGAYMDMPYFYATYDDICRPMDLEGAVDYIVHAASLASPQNYQVDPVGTLIPNCIGTYQLLELARKKGSRGFLFFSSGEVYGVIPQQVKEVVENTLGYVDPSALRSCYGESKRMGETMCKAWSHQYGVPAKSVRIFHTYGPTCDLKHDERIFSEFIGNIVNGQDIVMKSDGRSSRAFCYITDATDAFFRVLHKGEPGKAYNMGNSACLISVKELAKTLVDCFPEKNLCVITEKRLPDAAYLESPVKEMQIINTDKLEILGWKPRIGIKEGFRRTVESFRMDAE